MSVIEPTCGKGSFLVAAREAFPLASRVIGLEINNQYVEEARRNAGPSVDVCQADFFATDWNTLFASLPEPILIVGNLPWVTNAELGSLGSTNLPEKANSQNLSGLDALTGKSNFDISEWMLLRLLDASRDRRVMVAMLCKTVVARKVLLHAWKHGTCVSDARMYLIDADKHFGAAVDACCLMMEISASACFECSVFSSLNAEHESSTFGFRDSRILADVRAYDRTRDLEGHSPYRWRSGVKHDCGKVMEFRREGRFLRNGYGEQVELEDDYLFPMLKSSELARGKHDSPSRFMLIPQKSIGEDTSYIQHVAPATWDYLTRHADALDGRASSVYRGRPRFSVFGVGDYTFSPWKVAISGFYKKLDFTRVGSWHEKPIVLDDTSYFLPCKTEAEATILAELLNSDMARDFFSSLIFWDSKRPITISVLKLLDLGKLATTLGLEKELKKSSSRQTQMEFPWAS
ncbi:MAG: hypothetical protein JW818_21040 [Pirellulales bacterium]|nr:hypothetical protein [Pirellulales bacterium]